MDMNINIPACKLLHTGMDFYNKKRETEEE